MYKQKKEEGGGHFHLLFLAMHLVCLKNPLLARIHRLVRRACQRHVAPKLLDKPCHTDTSFILVVFPLTDARFLPIISKPGLDPRRWHPLCVIGDNKLHGNVLTVPVLVNVSQHPVTQGGEIEREEVTVQEAALGQNEVVAAVPPDIFKRILVPVTFAGGVDLLVLPCDEPRGEPYEGLRRRLPDREGKVQGVAGNDQVIVKGDNGSRRHSSQVAETIVEAVGGLPFEENLGGMLSFEGGREAKEG